MSSIPLNVSSPLRACKNVATDPLWIVKAKGEYIYDTEGNGYIDFMYGFGPLILGHAHEKIVSAIVAQAPNGTLFGTANYAEIALADKIVDSTPSIDKVRFLNSGTEAVASAVRIARAYTKRTKILYCYGGYHGQNDCFINSPDYISAGIDPATKISMFKVHYNDLQSIKEILVSEEFSCVVIEPVACNMSLVLPKDGYLEKLKIACINSGTLLIFDEVITGFRYCYGSVGNIQGVAADLYAFGKIIGGGLPVGAVAGSTELMQLLEDQTVLQGGTFSGNPLTVAAGNAALAVLKNPKTYEKMAQNVINLSEICSSKLKNKGVTLVSYGSTFALQQGNRAATNYIDIRQTTNNFYIPIYKLARKNNIHLTPDVLEPMHVSTVTSDGAIEQLACVFLEAL